LCSIVTPANKIGKNNWNSFASIDCECPFNASSLSLNSQQIIENALQLTMKIVMIFWNLALVIFSIFFLFFFFLYLLLRILLFYIIFDKTKILPGFAAVLKTLLEDPQCEIMGVCEC